MCREEGGEEDWFSTFEVEFETTWGTKDSPNSFETGTITYLELDGSEEKFETTGGMAGAASAKEAAEVGLEQAAGRPIQVVTFFAPPIAPYRPPTDRGARGSAGWWAQDWGII